MGSRFRLEDAKPARIVEGEDYDRDTDVGLSLFISRSASQLDRVLQKTNFALPIPDHASLVRGEASLGGGFGALLRFVPEIFRLFEDRRDANHEYRMMQLQIQSDKLRAQQKIDLAVLQGEIQESLKEGDAYIEALRGQQMPSGIRWVDALNASVRPMVTYWWLFLFTVYKGSLIASALIDWVGFKEFADAIWTTSDAGILSMILGFWFVDRVIRKQHGE